MSQDTLDLRRFPVQNWDVQTSEQKANQILEAINSMRSRIVLLRKLELASPEKLGLKLLDSVAATKVFNVIKIVLSDELLRVLGAVEHRIKSGDITMDELNSFVYLGEIMITAAVMSVDSQGNTEPTAASDRQIRNAALTCIGALELLMTSEEIQSITHQSVEFSPEIIYQVIRVLFVDMHINNVRSDDCKNALGQIFVGHDKDQIQVIMDYIRLVACDISTLVAEITVEDAKNFFTETQRRFFSFKLALFANVPDARYWKEIAELANSEA